MQAVRNCNHVRYEKFSKEVRPGLGQGVVVWPVVGAFTLFVAGDLQVYATVLGKENTGSCRCPHCDKSKTKWTESPEPGVTWTIDLLKRTAQTKPRDMKGVSEEPQWVEVEPALFICPLLHMEMGLVNKAVDEMMQFFDERVEVVPPEEQEQRKKVVEAARDARQARQRYEWCLCPPLSRQHF